MPPILPNLSKELASAIASAKVGVVSVHGRRRFPASGVVWSSDGVVVTAHHVVEHDDNINIGLPNGNPISCRLIGRDPTTDLAVLRLESNGHSKLEWATTDDLDVGHLVLALGRPGQSVRATLGIVSSLGNSWRTYSGGRIDHYLQPDVVMYPGFSGGPLIDTSGAVLGINTSALLRGVAITVPTKTVNRVVETLLAHGKIRRGYIGVGAQTASLPPNIAQQAGQEIGLLLVSVEPGSPAEKAGLVLGDAIITFDEQPIRHMDDLLQALFVDKIGVEVPVRVVRGGQIKNLKLTVGERN